MELRPLLLALLLCISPATSQYEIADQDLNALRKVKDSLTDIKHDKYAFFRSWNFSLPLNDPCTTFAGVNCTVVNGQLRVNSLTLGSDRADAAGLAGAISDEIYGLTELKQLQLEPGMVTGNIPSEIGHHLTNLHVIILSNNRLTGAIPESISDLQNLRILDLGYNDLTGEIPPALLLKTPNLNLLILENNELEGKIPEFNDQSQLNGLYLKRNMLTGEVPATIPATLNHLSLSNNRISSGLWMLAPLTNLTRLELSHNRFYGGVPLALFRPSLKLYLRRNNLAGHLPRGPPYFESYPQDSTVDLSHNYFTGEIPNYLNSVGSLYLNHNEFTGKLPGDIIYNVFIGRMRALYVQHNYLTAFPTEKTGNMVLPEGVELCLTFNCMNTTALGLSTCPPSVGGPFLRPSKQCSRIPP